MRRDGFKREDIVEAIRHCAPEAPLEQQQDRNWQRYAERAADYAFGVPGDLWLVSRAEERKQGQGQEKREDEVQQQKTPQEAPRLQFR